MRLRASRISDALLNARDICIDNWMSTTYFTYLFDTLHSMSFSDDAISFLLRIFRVNSEELLCTRFLIIL